MITFILGAIAAVGLSEFSKSKQPKMADGGILHNDLRDEDLRDYGLAIKNRELLKEFLDIVKLFLIIEPVNSRQYENISRYDFNLQEALVYFSEIGDKEIDTKTFDKYWDKLHYYLEEAYIALEDVINDYRELNHEIHFTDTKYAQNTIKIIDEIYKRLYDFKKNYIACLDKY